MTAIAPTENIVKRRQRQITWANLTQADYGTYYEFPEFSDKTVHVYGTFGVGGTVKLYGSNNPTDKTTEPTVGGSTWFPLTNVDGLGDISFAANGGCQILENPTYIACKVTAGTGVTVSVSIMGEREQ